MRTISISTPGKNTSPGKNTTHGKNRNSKSMTSRNMNTRNRVINFTTRLLLKEVMDMKSTQMNKNILKKERHSSRARTRTRTNDGQVSLSWRTRPYWLRFIIPRHD